MKLSFTRKKKVKRAVQPQFKIGTSFRTLGKIAGLRKRLVEEHGPKTGNTMFFSLITVIVIIACVFGPETADLIFSVSGN